MKIFVTKTVMLQTQKGPKHERRTIMNENVGDFFFFSSPLHMIRINNYTKISTLQVRAL